MAPSLKNLGTTTKSPSSPANAPCPNEDNESYPSSDEALSLPTFVAGSGTLDRLVETARDYAKHAASEKSYGGIWVMA